MGRVPALESFPSGRCRNSFTALIALCNTTSSAYITVPLVARIHDPVVIAGVLIRLMRLRLKLSDVAEHCSNPKARCTALIGALAICVATLDNFAQQLGRLIQVLLGFVGVLNEAMVGPARVL
ncbi:hypothetical protein [Pseudomonas aeruginosa]|uniref:hypothetical protein n=1 Tax=Pseudomonas aeruginosa TaxID=287 RepID=UPI003F4AEAAC